MQVTDKLCECSAHALDGWQRKVHATMLSRLNDDSARYTTASAQPEKLLTPAEECEVDGGECSNREDKAFATCLI